MVACERRSRVGIEVSAQGSFVVDLLGGVVGGPDGLFEDDPAVGMLVLGADTLSVDVDVAFLSSSG